VRALTPGDDKREYASARNNPPPESLREGASPSAIDTLVAAMQWRPLRPPTSPEQGRTARHRTITASTCARTARP
jgi:hypothetical protein